LFELSQRYGINVCLINYQGTVDESLLSEIESAMQSIDVSSIKEFFVLIQDEDIRVMSILDPLPTIPQPVEYVTERSCVIQCSNVPGSCTVTLHWNNDGAYVSASSPCYITSNVVSYTVDSNSLTFSGRFVLNKEPNYTKAFNLSGHYYLNGNPHDVSATGIVD
jgi:hypothetical protein